MRLISMYLSVFSSVFSLFFTKSTFGSFTRSPFDSTFIKTSTIKIVKPYNIIYKPTKLTLGIFAASGLAGLSASVAVVGLGVWNLLSIHGDK